MRKCLGTFLIARGWAVELKIKHMFWRQNIPGIPVNRHHHTRRLSTSLHRLQHRACCCANTPLKLPDTEESGCLATQIPSPDRSVRVQIEVRVCRQKCACADRSLCVQIEMCCTAFLLTSSLPTTWGIKKPTCSHTHVLWTEKKYKESQKYPNS